MKRRLFNVVYAAVAPILGARAAVWLAELAPALLFAGIPLLVFWLLFSGPIANRGADHQTCGAGPTVRDC